MESEARCEGEGQWSSQHTRQAGAITTWVRIIKTAGTSHLCCRSNKRTLPHICTAEVLTKHTTMVQGMDHAGSPPGVSAEILEETGQGLRCTEATADGQELKE